MLVDDRSPDAEVRATGWPALAAREPRVRVHEREENGGIVAASTDALSRAPASSSCCSTTTTCWPRTRSARVAEAVGRAPRRRLPLQRPGPDDGRGRDALARSASRTGRPSGCATTCTRPTSRCCGGRWPRGRRLPGRVRRLAGPRPGAAGHRAGPARRCTSRRCSTTGARCRARPPVTPRPSRGPGTPASARCRTTSTASASAATASKGRAPGHLPRRARAGPDHAGQHRHPDHRLLGRGPRRGARTMVVETVRSVLASTAPPRPGGRRRLRHPDPARRCSSELRALPERRRPVRLVRVHRAVQLQREVQRRRPARHRARSWSSSTTTWRRSPTASSSS